MRQLFSPDYYFAAVPEISPGFLHENDIEGIICDIDNTIVVWNNDELSDRYRDWFTMLLERGFEVCLISNGLNSRVEYFGRKLGVPAVGQAVKPLKRAFFEAGGKLEVEPEKIAVIGDQIFTDILGGNRAGFITILVDPIDRKEFFLTRFMRLFEKPLFNRDCTERMGGTK
ncbi:MAG: YqeG family HAD IIIA-type phosphatase [Halanaerobiaceae bacterium]